MRTKLSKLDLKNPKSWVVSKIISNQCKQYPKFEIIEFTETDIMSIPADQNLRTIQQIEQGLKDKFIKCEISNRNDQNYLICKVSHSGAGGY